MKNHRKIAKILFYIWAVLTVLLLLTYLTHLSLLTGLMLGALFIIYIPVVLSLFGLLILSVFRREWNIVRFGTGAILGTMVFLLYGQLAMDYLYFLSVRDGYLKEIAVKRAESKDPHAPVVDYFPWDGFLSNEYGVVYDETDQDISIRHAFIMGEKQDDSDIDAECSIDLTSFGGHFYLRYLSC